MSHRDLAPTSVVVLVADGVRPDTLRAALDDGTAPALARLRTDGALHDVVSVFPSVTGPAYTPFLLGRHPARVGLPGIRWFDRARTATRWPSWSRSYVGVEMRHLDRDLDPAVPTAFELAPTRLAAMSVIERGLSARDRVVGGPAFAMRAGLIHLRGDARRWIALDRDVAGAFATRWARERPAFAFCALTGIDKASHAFGHASPEVRDAITVVDALAARIRGDAERAGHWERTHLWIVSDHGHSPVHTHDDLADLLRALGVRTRAHPFAFGAGQDAAVMVSGNAMAHVYLDLGHRAPPGWPALRARWGWLADALLERPSCDLLILPHGEGRCEIRSRARGTAWLTETDGRLSYRPDTGDPLGVGPLESLTADEALDLTRDSDYPDALAQVAALAASRRAGDVIASAARGFDFRAHWEPIPHVSAHGALHRDHLVVPLLVNRPPRAAPRRTVDVFATAAHLLDFATSGEGANWH